MAHILQIMSSTDNVVTFTSGDMYLQEYTPEVSENGADIREKARIGFTGTLATARANVQAVNRLFEQARNYERTATGARVYMEFDPGTSGTLYRSQVRTGAVRLRSDVLGGMWGAANLELDVEWTRVGYWEGPLTQIPISNVNDTDNTSGLTVNNAWDDTHDNTFTVSSSDVAGDMPAPFYLEAVNATANSDGTDEIYLFHNVYSNPAGFVHIYEGENTSTDTASTSTASTDCSDGYYAAMSWTGTGETMLYDCTISSSDLTDAAGGRFAILARWQSKSSYTDMWLRLKLTTWINYETLWTGNLSLLSATTDGRELTWIDTLRLPPALEGQSNIGYVNLLMYGKRATTDTHELNLDYFQLSPISGDGGWKRFKSVDSGIIPDETFVFDGIEGFVYRLNSTNGKFAEFSSYGGPILLVPGVTQKLYMLTCNWLGVAAISQNWTVKLWYRPRRNAL